MRKIFFAIVLLCATAAMAQNEALTATLQHDSVTTVYTGVDAFLSAYTAAQSGDVITLSAGTFNIAYDPPRAFPKSISIYGAGYEKNEETGAEVTNINGSVYSSIDICDGDIYLEGLNFRGNLYVNDCDGNDTVSNFHMTKCYVNGSVIFNTNATSSQVSQCVITGNVQGTNAQNLLVSNCWIGGTVAGFVTNNSVVVRNSLISGFQGSASTWMNCVFTGLGSYQSYGSGLGLNCIFRSDVAGWQQYGIQTVNCYTVVCSEIFADGNDASYSAERTFELQQPETWIGTDGTEAGIHGGDGWSKTPATPVINNLQLEVEGNTLNVSYDAEVR